MKSQDLYYLEHILTCINDTEIFLKSKTKKQFSESKMIQYAILHSLQIMAESTKRVNTSLKLQVSDVPWHEISNFRNRLVHEYLGIDLGIIWNVIKTDLPKLKKRVKQMIKFVEAKNKK